VDVRRDAGAAAVASTVCRCGLQLTHLIDGLDEAQLGAMVLGLGHSLSRYKLKFSPDKVDTMIVQAIGLLDDLDKEINTYAMRVKEWYGWHFPEVSCRRPSVTARGRDRWRRGIRADRGACVVPGVSSKQMAKIVADNLQYAKVILKMGTRNTAATEDFSDILAEEVEAAMKESANVSMGTDISEEDVSSIKELCSQVRRFSASWAVRCPVCAPVVPLTRVATAVLAP
jgi:nucleolar protein 58